ncbi:MAG: hypothetical protein MUP19_07815 [Candidatus Aminicenantes bacterium]|nr:hypothetical protein [Candidatus Aminicenantes bacterium]
MTLKERLRNFLTRQPFPPTAFQLTMSGLAGVHRAGRDHRSGRHVILPLRPGSLEPSFDRPNIKDAAHVSDRVREALRQLNIRDHNVSLLIPESSLKSAILSFDELPDSPAEREQLILWRLRKQMPSLPENIRLSVDVLGADRPRKVFVSVIHSAVLAEYEGLFSRQGARVRNVSLAILSLSNLLSLENTPSGILANIEEDGLSLLAIVKAEAAFYRSKPFLPDSQEARSFARRMENVAREIISTVTFLEDREKTRVETLWIRAAPANGNDDPLASLKSMVPLALRPVEPDRWAGLKAGEARLLAPLIGLLP